MAEYYTKEEADTEFYLRTALTTSGQSAVHFDNLTNVDLSPVVTLAALTEGVTIDIDAGITFLVAGTSAVNVLLEDGPTGSSKEITIIGTHATNTVTFVHTNSNLDFMIPASKTLKTGDILKLLWCDEEEVWREIFSYISS